MGRTVRWTVGRRAATPPSVPLSAHSAPGVGLLVAAATAPASAGRGTAMTALWWAREGPVQPAVARPMSGTLSEPALGTAGSSRSSALTCCRSAAWATTSDRPCV
jgi:hypothetical protein